MIYQNLSTFRLPKKFRGRSALTVQLWWVIQALLFAPSPQILYGWRRFLLRLFGAKIGTHVIIRPSVRITYPWKISIGDYSQIGDGVELYSLGEIEIGAHCVISQGSYICTGGHDPCRSDFAIYEKKITIEDQVWLAAQCFVMPGVTIKQGAFAMVRSLITKDVPEGVRVAGQPAKVIGARVSSS